MNKKTIIAAMIIAGSAASSLTALDPIKRKPFHVPLPLITLLFDGTTFDEAFVTFGNTGEGWAIGPVDDRYVKDTPRERIDHFYREHATSAHYISPFEAQVLERVSKKFEETLTIYERDLKGGNWERLVYLDEQLTVFMRGFFYLYCASYNSFSALPKVTRVADTLYEETPNSIKSDRRVITWRENPEQVVKLRIAAKELQFQMKQWRSKALANTEYDPRQDNTKQFRETYELFVRLYFNLPPASVLRKKIF